jgi:4-hydroxyphenylacetate 3-monooxygenase
MRTGADYREALRDGRKVFVMGGGHVDDVTTHPATSAMVEQYVAWYDRHFDYAWADTLLTPRSWSRCRSASPGILLNTTCFPSSLLT